MRLALIHPQTRVYVCVHAVEDPARLCIVSHDLDGDWQFLCERDHAGSGPEEICLVHAEHLDEMFPLLRGLERVPLGGWAELIDGAWQVFTDDETPERPGSDSDLDSWAWTCACCGQPQRGMPELAFRGPDNWAARTGDPSIVEIEKTTDLCVLEIDGERSYYIRALLPIPLAFGPPERDHWCFGIWASLSEENFARYRETLEDDARGRLGGMFSWLCNGIPGYGAERLTLVTVPQDGRRRPFCFVQYRHETHPLFTEQRDGWDEATARERLSNFFRHG
ncbi:MAG: DUF2199 domain-containing protein [Paracoccaceae bacterium]